MSAIPKSDESILLREDRDGVCTLTLNRPTQMNLLTTEMLEALQEAFDAIAGDRRVRVVVLAANGKGFCAGHDVKEIRALKELPKIEELFGKCSRMMQTIIALPQPVIARVQGVAAAAGCQLVAQCDLAVASEAARFTTPGVTWGFFCSTPGVASTSVSWAPAYLDASQQFEQFRPDRIPPKGLETSYYSNTTVTDLVVKAGAEVDQQKRKDEYCQAAKQVWTDAPWIFLYNQSFPIVYSAKVTGVSAFPNEKFDTRFAAPA